MMEMGIDVGSARPAGGGLQVATRAESPGRAQARRSGAGPLPVAAPPATRRLRSVSHSDTDAKAERLSHGRTAGRASDTQDATTTVTGDGYPSRYHVKLPGPAITDHDRCDCCLGWVSLSCQVARAGHHLLADMLKLPVTRITDHDHQA
jgi:hypothetical protein